MPWTAPKSLKPDEVYAILAYLLNLQEIVPADFELSDKNIAKCRSCMPNRNGMTTDHGMWPGASAKKGGIGNGGVPDVKNVACMKNCKPEVQIGSTLPDYARTAHGELADQNRLRPGARHPHARPGSRQEGSRCRHAGTGDEERLHGLPWREANKIVGPGYNEVVARYQDQADAESKLVAKVKAGGQGVWGSIPMPPNGHVKDEDITTLVKWIVTVPSAVTPISTEEKS
jgi:hypothetical protein